LKKIEREQERLLYDSLERERKLKAIPPTPNPSLEGKKKRERQIPSGEKRNNLAK